MTYAKTLKNLLNDFICLFFPELCLLCKEPLVKGEMYLCLECSLQIPKTDCQTQVSETIEERLAGKFPFEKAASYLFYNKGGIGSGIISEIKYKRNKKFGKWFSEKAAKDILESGFFEGIDLIVPIPLHKKKQKKRGFNQAELIAAQLAGISSIPLNTQSLYRKIANPTQTKKGNFERWLNTLDIFDLKEKESFSGKHILLVDDVLTTGSTLEAAARCVLLCNRSKISILTLAIAQ